MFGNLYRFFGGVLIGSVLFAIGVACKDGLNPTKRKIITQIHKLTKGTKRNVETQTRIMQRNAHSQANVLPESFICPLTQEIMKDPVITPSGQCYEREEIEIWLSLHGTCPITRQSLRKNQLIPCITLRNSIEEYQSIQ